MVDEKCVIRYPVLVPRRACCPYKVIVSNDLVELVIVVEADFLFQTLAKPYASLAMYTAYIPVASRFALTR